MANRPKGYGLTAEVTRKQDQKYDTVAEQEAVEWINNVLGGTELGDACGKDVVQDKLKDGMLLLRFYFEGGGLVCFIISVYEI